MRAGSIAYRKPVKLLTAGIYKSQLTKSQCWVEQVSLRNIDQFTVWWGRTATPVALAWAQLGLMADGSTRAEIVHAYTMEQYRRCGLRSMINDFLFENANVSVILSTVGSAEGGYAFMQAAGYRICEQTGYWYLTKARWKQAKRKASGGRK